MTLNNTTKIINFLRAVDVGLSSILRSFLIFTTTITAFTFTGLLTTKTLGFAAILFGAILLGSLAFDVVARGLKYISDMMIKRQMDKMLDNIQDIASKDPNFATRALPTLPTDNGNFN